GVRFSLPAGAVSQPTDKRTAESSRMGRQKEDAGPAGYLAGPTSQCASRLPASRVAINSSTSGSRVNRFTSAGPGHRPTSPQPTPNSTAPLSRRASMRVSVGSWKDAAHTGAARLRLSQKANAKIVTADPITAISAGSQAPNTSRKARTLAG